MHIITTLIKQLIYKLCQLTSNGSCIFCSFSFSLLHIHWFSDQLLIVNVNIWRISPHVHVATRSSTAVTLPAHSGFTIIWNEVIESLIQRMSLLCMLLLCRWWLKLLPCMFLWGLLLLLLVQWKDIVHFTVWMGLKWSWKQHGVKACTEAHIKKRELSVSVQTILVFELGVRSKIL